MSWVSSKYLLRRTCARRRKRSCQTLRKGRKRAAPRSPRSAVKEHGSSVVTPQQQDAQEPAPPGATRPPFSDRCESQGSAGTAPRICLLPPALSAGGRRIRCRARRRRVCRGATSSEPPTSGRMPAWSTPLRKRRRAESVGSLSPTTTWRARVGSSVRLAQRLRNMGHFFARSPTRRRQERC